MGKIKFGPAGIPIQCKGSSTLDGIQCCSDLGLNAMEIQFGMGVRLKKEIASEIKTLSKKLEISISSHAPYFVNLCSEDKKKFEISKRNLFQAGEITSLAGGELFVFHPGFYQKLTIEEAYKNALTHLKEVKEKFDQHSIKIIFGAETVGKKSAFGSIYEIIKLSQELDFIKPVIDFAHLHARGDFRFKNKEDYLKLFNKLEKELPDYLKQMHCHFSEINYSQKGEKNHLVFGSNNEPPFKPLMEVLAEQGYSGTIICESPNLDIDALKMQEHYIKILGNKK